ncbi:hypothetical protein HBH64_198080 [Parastagonospora nodorum]|nr:hypothetical protein HBH66_201490 [Parastagonospora nodorum]KAH4739871.1 hypothetical protein HBH64_198080 [Parastagonospora nodorum]KAH5007098.1 hypothetical protein HBI74_217680 [Parastagonospora nodorum]KAH5171217.1 hypothetical protein HBH77_225560 [Parastagonospora nodorum]KAH5448470.1 hypothetical protein HBI30_169460 [Parastagonospora nodorum]
MFAPSLGSLFDTGPPPPDPSYYAIQEVAKSPTYFGSQPFSFRRLRLPIDELGGTASNPLPITTPLTLYPGSWLWIVSSYPVMLATQGFLHAPEIGCVEAMYFFARVKTTLMPTRPLGSKFALGWTKLPTELKVSILEVNLKTVRANGIWNQHVLFHHLRMTPEIATLAKGIYYTSSATRLEVGLGFFISSGLKYPSRTMNHLVHRLEVGLRLGNPNQWSQLEKVASGRLGFLNLEHVQVHICEWGFKFTDLSIETSDSIKARIDRECKQYIQFSCHGELVFTPITGKGGAIVPAAVQQRMQNMLTFRVKFKENLEDEL